MKKTCTQKEVMVDMTVDDATSETIGEVLSSIVSRSRSELLTLTAEQLQERWYFRLDNSASVEWNLYKFSDALERFKRDCRAWEEHHNGSLCVVERVRDKYLMPRLREVTSLLQKQVITE